MQPPSKKWKETRLAVLEGTSRRIFEPIQTFVENCFIATFIVFAAGYVRFNYFSYPDVSSSISTAIQVGVAGLAMYGLMILMIVLFTVGFIHGRIRREIDWKPAR